MSKLELIFTVINGKKTYIVALLIGVLAVAQMLGFHVPEAVWLLLNALGYGAVRDAIGKLEAPGQPGASRGADGTATGV